MVLVMRIVVALLVPMLTACNALIGLEDHVLDAGASTSGGGGCADVEYVVEADEDDAMWNRAMAIPDEQLTHADGTGGIYVGNDADQECAAVRFAIDLPRGAHISEATLQLTRIAGNNVAGDTLKIHVWEPPDLPPFDDAHNHGPEEHGPAGLGDPSVQGWKPGVIQLDRVPVDVTKLAQHLVDHEAYTAGQHIGFLLRPLLMGDRHVAFMDSSITTTTPNPASLVVSYCGP
jgi:hypothetical protein